MEEIEKLPKVKKLEEELRVNKLKNLIDAEKYNSFKNSILSKSLIGIFGIIAFIVVTFVSLHIFSIYGIDKTISPIFSLMAGVFTTYIIFIAGRIVKEFTIKGGTVELSAKLQEEIKNVQNDVKQSKKEIEGVSKQIQQIHNMVSAKISSEIYNGDVIQIGKEKNEKVLKKLKGMGVIETSEEHDLLEKHDKLEINTTQRKIIEKDIDESEAYDKVIKDMTGKSMMTPHGKSIRAKYFISIHEYQKANELYDELLHEGHSDTSLLFNKARTLYGLGNYENAITFFKRIEADESHPGIVQNDIGLCYTAMGENEISRKYFKKAIELSPNATNESNLAASYYLENMEMFHKLIDEVYKKYPSHNAVLLWKSIDELDRGNYAEAITHLDKIPENDVNYLSVKSTKGLVLVLKGERKMGLKLLNETFEQDPSNTEGLYEMAEAQSFLKNRDLALFYLKKSIILKPDRKSFAKNDKLFNFLKNDEEFKKIIES